MQKQNLENKMDPKLPSIELQLKDLKKKISKESLGGKNRTGYWCNLCDISFSTSKLLIDHMGKNIHVKEYKQKL